MDQQQRTGGGKQRHLLDLHGAAGRGRNATEILKALDYLYDYRPRGFGLDLIRILTPIYIISGLLATHEFPGLRLEFFVYTGVSLACYLLVFTGWSFADRAQYKKLLTGILTFDDALELVENGGPELGRIHGWIPWPFSMFFSRRLPATIPARIRLLARNIDWYLDEPRPLVRWHWVALALFWLVSIPHVAANLCLSPKVASPGDPAVLITVVTVTVMLQAVFLTIAEHSQLREGLRIEVLHDLLKPYLESLVGIGQDAEEDLLRKGLVEEEVRPPLFAGPDWVMYATALSSGIAYVLIRLAGAAPAWLHRPVNLLIAVVTWYFASRLLCLRLKTDPVDRLNHWLFALYLLVAALVGFAIAGPLERSGHTLELKFLFLLICIAGVLPVASRLLQIRRDKLGEFMAGLAVWNILIFGIIGLIAIALRELGYIPLPG